MDSNDKVVAVFFIAAALILITFSASYAYQHRPYTSGDKVCTHSKNEWTCESNAK